MKGLFILTVLSLLFTASVGSVSASNYGSYTNPCHPVYGGNNPCPQPGSLIINKTVANPQNGTYVDNLGVDDPKYPADSVVSFQLTIINNSTATVKNAIVTDTFPQFVSFNSGAGSFDKNSKTLSFEVAELKAGESKTYTVSGKTAKASDMPNDQAVICVTNQSKVMANGQTNQDNASFCIQKEAGPVVSVPTKGGMKVYPSPNIKTTPATGPEMAFLFSIIPMGSLGYLLRKKSQPRA